MPELIVVSGPPGAGKSTVARLLVARYSPSALVVGDAFFGFVRAGYVDPWLSEAAAQNETVTTAAAAAAGAYVAGGFTTVYDGVLGPWLLDGFAHRAGVARLHYAVLLPSADRCVERALARPDVTITDAEAIRHLHRTFATAAVEQRHVLSSDRVGPTETADLIRLRARSGSLLYAPPRSP